MRPCADYKTLYADCSTRGVLLAKVNAEQCATIIKMFILVRTVDASKKRTWETGQKDVRYRYWIVKNNRSLKYEGQLVIFSWHRI